MAVDFRINGLGGLNVGQAVNQGYNLYQQQRQNTMQDEAMAKQEDQQAELQGLMSGAAKGDVNAIESLYAKSPELAAQFEQRDLARVEREGQKVAQESKQREVDFATRYRAATADQKPLLLQEAAADALIDIDEDDLSLNPDQAEAAVNLMLFQNLGKDGYKALVADTRPEVTTEYQKGMLDAKKVDQNLRKQELELKRLESGQKLKQKQDEANLDIDTAQTKEERKLGVKALSEIAAKSRNATVQLGTLSRIEQLNKKAASGTLAEIRLGLLKAADALGLDVKGASESEILIAISNDLVLGKSQQMSGSLSNADMSFLQNTAPQLSQTTEGRKKIIEYSKAMFEREKEYAKAAQAFRKENGYFNLSEFNDEFDAENNPLFSGGTEPQEEVEISASELVTPSGIKFTVSEG